MSFLTPLAFAAAALALPIVLLYMLRLRRREVTVSSTFLWQQILLDREANTPWQRLRRNLLLFLQLLILVLLVLALARPFIVVPAVSAGQTALLLDASASMNSTDSSDGTRFDEARRRALEIVDTLDEGSTMTIIRVADVPEVLTPYTSDRALLRAALANAQPSAARADWGAALTLAGAGAAAGGTGDDFNIVLVSDGNLGAAVALPAVAADVELVAVGQTDANIAVSALATRALAGEPPQLFAQITNYGGRDAEVVFDLRVDGELFTAERYTVPGGGSLPIVSAALPPDFTTLQAGITIPAEHLTADALPLDNTAWAVAPGGGTRRILLMSQGNTFLRRALDSLPTVEVFEGDPARGLPQQPYDLVVLDGWLPAELPAGDLLIIDPPTGTRLFSLTGASDQTGNPRAVRDDPRMTYVDVDAVNIAAFSLISADWAQPLISADGGDLLLAGEVEGRQVAILTFSLFDSDLPLNIAFPILLANLLDWYRPQEVVFAPDGLQVGDSLVFTPPLTAETVRVTLPDGTTRDLPADRDQLVFAETRTPGVYTVEVFEGGAVAQTAAFAVNLFDAGESRIAPQTSVTIGTATIAPSAQDELGQREFWQALALAAILILLIEWYAYHRRLRAPTVFRPLARPRPSA